MDSKDLLRNSSGTGANQYESFVFNGTEYMVGDDIVITMPKEEGLWGVARITKIYHDPLADDIPLLRLLWFWRATEVTKYPMFQLSEHIASKELKSRNHIENIPLFWSLDLS